MWRSEFEFVRSEATRLTQIKVGIMIYIKFGWRLLILVTVFSTTSDLHKTKELFQVSHNGSSYNKFMWYTNCRFHCVEKFFDMK